jgi:hypothetical protein
VGWRREELTLARDVIFNEVEMAETAISHPAEAFPEEESESLSEMASEALKLVDLDSIDEEAPIAASMRSVILIRIYRIHTRRRNAALPQSSGRRQWRSRWKH